MASEFKYQKGPACLKLVQKLLASANFKFGVFMKIL